MRTCGGTQWPGGCGPAVPGGCGGRLRAAAGHWWAVAHGAAVVGWPPSAQALNPQAARCRGGRLAARRPGTGGESAGGGSAVNRQAAAAALGRLG